MLSLLINCVFRIFRIGLTIKVIRIWTIVA
jgi:hypothetical protein